MRARVSGYITKVAFVAGALVKQGDLLFEIDPREYQAAVALRRGRDRPAARRPRARSAEVGRTQRLRPSGAASEREVETATAARGRPRVSSVAATAQLEKAKLDLEFTRVTAPIAGRASHAEITAGNLVVVGASGGPLLTTIVSIDPIWVYFDIDEPSMLRLREARASPHRAPPHAGERRQLEDPGAARPRERDRSSPHGADRLRRQPGRPGDRHDARARGGTQRGPPSSRRASSCACACRRRAEAGGAGHRARRRHRSGPQVRARRERPERGRVPPGAARPARGRAPRDQRAA